MRSVLLAALLGLTAVSAQAFTVEIYRPGTLLNSAPVALEVDGSPIGELGPGERMRCRFDGPVTFRAYGTDAQTSGHSFHARSTALVRLGVELSAATLSRHDGHLKFAIVMERAERGDKEVFGTERAGIVREVPCGVN